MTFNSLPFYLVEKNDPVVAQYKDVIESAMQQNEKRLTLTFDAREVANMLIDKFEDVLSALQHCRTFLPGMIHNVDIQFLRFPNTNEVIPEQEWSANPLYHRFLYKMFTEAPYAIFFTRDFNLRLYMIAGDYTRSNNESVTRVESPKGPKVRTLHGAQSAIKKRLFEAGVTMLLYCHGLNFNPKQTIINLLNEYFVSPEFSKIYKQYEKDMQNSIALPSVATNNNPPAGQTGSAAA